MKSQEVNRHDQVEGGEQSAGGGKENSAGGAGSARSRSPRNSLRAREVRGGDGPDAERAARGVRAGEEEAGGGPSAYATVLPYCVRDAYEFLLGLPKEDLLGWEKELREAVIRAWLFHSEEGAPVFMVDIETDVRVVPLMRYLLPERFLLAYWIEGRIGAEFKIRRNCHGVTCGQLVFPGHEDTGCPGGFPRGKRRYPGGERPWILEYWHHFRPPVPPPAPGFRPVPPRRSLSFF